RCSSEFSLSNSDLFSFPTRRSSDLQNDGANFSNYGDNARRVVTMSNIGTGVIFDGFMVEGANGNGNAGAFFISGNSSPTIQDCVDRKSTRLNSSHVKISYAVFCLKK